MTDPIAAHTPSPSGWLPDTFTHPLRVDWGGRVHLRPIRAADVDIDMTAVMGNQQMLWVQYGNAWGWPPATMTRDADEEDLQRHADDMERHESFNYAILPTDEQELYGCLYIDPRGGGDGHEAEVSWWLTPGAPAWLHDQISALALDWIRTSWPFSRVHTPFNQLSGE